MRESEIQKSLASVDKQFGLAIAEQNETAFQHILTEVRTQNQKLFQLASDVEAELTTLGVVQHFFHHFEFDVLKIQLRNLEQAFKMIALEILGHEAKISNFPVYQLSESLQTAMELVVDRMGGLVMEANDVSVTMGKHPDGNFDAESKAHILTGLDHIIHNATAATEEIVRDYSIQLVRLARNQQQLNIAQRIETETLIEILINLIEYSSVVKGNLQRIG